MRIEKYIIPIEIRPKWVEYPSEFIKLLNSERIDLTPWHIIEYEFSLREHFLLEKRYGRLLLPFAIRQDNDDTACLEKGFGQSIKIIHNYASKGWENVSSFSTFSDWLQDVEEEMKDW